MAAPRASGKVIENLTARIFCQLKGKGGNTVEVFYPANDIPTKLRQEFAKTCEWESVFVESSPIKRMAFYLPTGEQVSFCAHAAMGGSVVLSTKKEERMEFQAVPLSNVDNAENSVRLYHSTVHHDKIVSLDMEASWSQERVPHPPTLHRILRDHHGLHPNDLVPPETELHFPTFVNSSVARNKTLVYLNATEALHNAKTPINSEVYQRACDAIDSTGLYLYARNLHDDRSFVCVSSVSSLS